MFQEHRRLLNFNVPNSTRSRFDGMCRLNGRTMTSVLVELMDEYVLGQTAEVSKRNQQLLEADRIVREAPWKPSSHRHPSHHRPSSTMAGSDRSNRHPEPFFFGFSDGREDV